MRLKFPWDANEYIMKNLLSLFILFTLIGCNPTGKETPEDIIVPDSESELPTRQIVESIQPLLDSANCIGSVLFYKVSNNMYYSNNFTWAEKGHLPASTFKIPNSIVALELGIVKNDSSMFYWDGEDRFQDRWERDLNFKEALQLSCVPCYQNLAREIGPKRMIETLDKIEYPGMVIDSTNIDMFWLLGESRITSFEQIDFLNHFYNKELPISENTYFSMKNMLLIEDSPHFKLSGKSGWSYTNGIDNCWFVGYIEESNELYFFATNLEPGTDVDLNSFPQTRYDITMKMYDLVK